MLKVLLPTDIPEIKIPENATSNWNQVWYCRVDYDITDLSNDKTTEYRKNACYSGMWYTLKEMVLSHKELKNAVKVRYWCKTQGLSVRLPLLEFIARRFSHFFGSMTLGLEKEEPYIEVVSKPTTPMEAFYALGAHLRLTWEQWSPKWDTTDPLKYIVQASSMQFGGHVPNLFFMPNSYSNNFGGHFQKCSEEDKLDLMKIVFHTFRYEKVFSQVLQKLNRNSVVTPYLQEKTYLGVIHSNKFQERFPDLAKKYSV